MNDPVKSPDHYKLMSCVIEPIEVTYAMHSCLGQVLQYILRYKLKGNPIQDLGKARFGLDWFTTRYFEKCGFTKVQVMATASEKDEALRDAFRTCFQTDDKTIDLAVNRLLQKHVNEMDIRVVWEEVNRRIKELAGARHVENV